VTRSAQSTTASARGTNSRILTSVNFLLEDFCVHDLWSRRRRSRRRSSRGRRNLSHNDALRGYGARARLMRGQCWCSRRRLALRGLFSLWPCAKKEFAEDVKGWLDVVVDGFARLLDNKRDLTGFSTRRHKQTIALALTLRFKFYPACHFRQ
jgi:hypothetical protein